jgi:antitoxin HigA-1
MPMHDPPHPGEHVRYDCLEPLGLTVTRAAQILGVSRKALSELVNGRAGISPEMAIRLSKAFGGSPEVWVRMQMSYDLWHAQQNADRIKVARYVPA